MFDHRQLIGDGPVYPRKNIKQLVSVTWHNWHSWICSHNFGFLHLNIHSAFFALNESYHHCLDFTILHSPATTCEFLPQKKKKKINS
jgi:hypothetical protein